MPSAAAHPPITRCPSLDDAVVGLYQDHHSWLTSWLRGKLGNQADAADLAHDTFTRILQSRLLAGGIEEPRSLLSTIARGLVIDLWRRRALEQAYQQVLESLPEEHVPSLEAQAIVKERLIELDCMLDGLGSKVKQVFLLSIIAELPYPEIASRVGVSPRTVSNYLAKAMAQCCLWID